MCTFVVAEVVFSIVRELHRGYTVVFDDVLIVAISVSVDEFDAVVLETSFTGVVVPLKISKSQPSFHFASELSTGLVEPV